MLSSLLKAKRLLLPKKSRSNKSQRKKSQLQLSMLNHFLWLRKIHQRRNTLM
jgi:hypothetical protein